MKNLSEITVVFTVLLLFFVVVGVTFVSGQPGTVTTGSPGSPSGSTLSGGASVTTNSSETTEITAETTTTTNDSNEDVITNCTDGELKCIGLSLNECINGSFVLKETCEFGCENGVCLLKTSENQPKSKVWWIISASILLAVLFGFIVYSLVFAPNKLKKFSFKKT